MRIGVLTATPIPQQDATARSKLGQMTKLAVTRPVSYPSSMAIDSVTYPHLHCAGCERPVIAGKNFKVIHLIREHVAYGWSAEELALNHPQLTLGEIYSALAYYADHRDEIDRDLSASEAEADRMHSEPRHRRVAGRLKRSAQP